MIKIDVRLYFSLILIAITTASCHHNNKTVRKNYFKDSIAIKETNDIIQAMQTKLKNKIFWPGPVKGYPHYHFEKPVTIDRDVIIYLIRDYVNDSVETFEDFVYYKGKVIVYKYDYRDRINFHMGRYLFKDECLIDSSTFIYGPLTQMIHPFPPEAIIAKARNRYYLAVHKTDSLFKSIELLKDSLDALRSGKD